jgi:2-polyprenyl-3-methyl-5-hydroxy-6-metoxy-1,4-benzoquinol methylase
MPDSVPNLEGFELILELLAKHTRTLSGSPYKEEWVRESIVAAGTKLRALNYILKRKQPGKSVLLMDLGAQIGSFAIYAARLGLKVGAIDYSYFAEPYGTFANQHGVDYRACDVAREPLPFPDDSFDYVTYMDVIEHHAYSPKGVLLEVFRVLKPGGCVIITTPNHASIYNRFTLLMGKSVNDPFCGFFERSDPLTVYPGHHPRIHSGGIERGP